MRGLEAVYFLKLVEREGLVFAFDVERLAADHSCGAGGGGEFFDERGNRIGRRVGGEGFEGEGGHGVAGENGERFAEDFVIGGLAAAEVIIVHGGEIVVDEREGVNELDGDGGCDGGGIVGAAAAGEGGFQNDAPGEGAFRRRRRCKRWIL